MTEAEVKALYDIVKEAPKEEVAIAAWSLAKKVHNLKVTLFCLGSAAIGTIGGLAVKFGLKQHKGT